MDGKTNPKIQSIHLERFPVHRAQFSRDGEMVIATSLKNKMFYLYDMMEGRVTPVHTVRGESGVRGQGSVSGVRHIKAFKVNCFDKVGFVSSCGRVTLISLISSPIDRMVNVAVCVFRSE